MPSPIRAALTSLALVTLSTAAGCAVDAGAGGAAPIADAGADGPTDDDGASDAAAPSDDAITPPPSDSGAAPPDTTPPPPDAPAQDADAPPPTDASGPAPTKTPLGKYVITWYSFQDNTPVNSALSASGRQLIPYLSVAVPFRLLKPFGGALSYGDRLFLSYLEGRAMPSGRKHSGWVQIDDFCGDSGDDSYCFQTVGGATYPNTDLYIGDFTRSGMSNASCDGPAGDGAALTDVSTGDPGGAWIGDYGGAALGSGKCGDLATAKPQQSGCWDYTPPASSAADCAGCSKTSCTTW